MTDEELVGLLVEAAQLGAAWSRENHGILRGDVVARIREEFADELIVKAG